MSCSRSSEPDSSPAGSPRRRALLGLLLVGGCVGELPPRAEGAPCHTDVECASQRCATAAPGGGYCVHAQAEAEGYPCNAETPCTAPLACRDLGARRWCNLPGQAACDPGFTACGEACRHLPSDADACGACEVACPQGAWCESGRCVCPADHPDVCDDRCIDISRDSDHCGGCDTPCSLPHDRCRDGRCETVTCPAGWLRCQDDAGCTTPVGEVLQATLSGAGPAQAVGQAVTLEAAATEPVATWHWRLVEGPPGSLAPEGARATLALPLTGRYTVEAEPVEGPLPVCLPARLTVRAVPTSAFRIELIWEGAGELGLLVRHQASAWEDPATCRSDTPEPRWDDGVCVLRAVAPGAQAADLDGLSATAALRVAVHHRGGEGPLSATLRIVTAGPPPHLVYQAVGVVVQPGHLWDVGTLPAAGPFAVSGAGDWLLYPFGDGP